MYYGARPRKLPGVGGGFVFMPPMDDWHSRPDRRNARRRDERHRTGALAWGIAVLALVLAMVAFMYFALVTR